jgi:AraC-like DNA-binding protein
MLSVQTRTPDIRLHCFVRSYVQRETQQGDAETVEPVVARLGTMLEFQFAQPYVIPIYGSEQILVSPKITVIGPVTHRRVRLIIRQDVQALAVLFQPQGFRALFGIPTFTVSDLGVDARGLLGSTVSELYERLGNTKSFTERAKFLDEFLLDCLSRNKPLSGIHRVLNQLIVAGPRRPITDIAWQAGVTIRQLERKSLEYTGLTPQTLVRIARFQHVLRMKSASSISWTKLAHALDYHDQMHMIRDFRVFAGDTPLRAYQEIGPEHLIGY